MAGWLIGWLAGLLQNSAFLPKAYLNRVKDMSHFLNILFLSAYAFWGVVGGKILGMKASMYSMHSGIQAFPHNLTTLNNLH